tara:strand:- start:84 stop:245 length:162 start_codon:yes stop_codon:yes gene_type:complete
MEERFAVVNEARFFQAPNVKEEKSIILNSSGTLESLIVTGREGVSSTILKEIW